MNNSELWYKIVMQIGRIRDPRESWFDPNLSSQILYWMLRALSVCCVFPMMFRSSTYIEMIENPKEDFLMKTHGKPSLLE
jgi:hypothetical protein